MKSPPIEHIWRSCTVALGLSAIMLTTWAQAPERTGPATAAPAGVLPATPAAEQATRAPASPEQLARMQASQRYHQAEFERTQRRQRELQALKPRQYDPALRENAPPAYFPNTSITPEEPPAVPQTHGLDLSQHSPEVAKAYFNWLCANEAGDFIFHKVEGVDSVFEMRPREEYSQGWVRTSKYFWEDPVGRAVSADKGVFYQPEVEGMYPGRHGSSSNYKKWYDRAAAEGLKIMPYEQYNPEQGYVTTEAQARPIDQARYGPGRFVRFTRVWPTHPEYDRDPQGHIRMFQDRRHLNPAFPSPVSPEVDNWVYSIHVDEFHTYLKSRGHIPPQAQMGDRVQSKYGFMWRGIARSPHDREFGIAGNEVLVYDLTTNKLLGVRRNFLWAPLINDEPRSSAIWLLGRGQRVCRDHQERFEKMVLPPPDPYVGLTVSIE
ncbi:hypothetical protein [Aquabacterium sp. OR-4]|uniref:hypothetical protein n=1 Tax=Aquabacterium sp. OR-4 TaxID=2978127 RepID=UPI0021B461C6|nr:hypothetical protein [Aquabacterium sp. OR-4]MDT7834849.1 hypothetical protein [Aquabacterium sp. OR-4]